MALPSADVAMLLNLGMEKPDDAFAVGAGGAGRLARVGA
jgi:hypothetical protein